jgi:hypothetical protein
MRLILICALSVATTSIIVLNFSSQDVDESCQHKVVKKANIRF